MTWNYRIIRRVVEGEAFYSIHEVFYDDAGEPEMVTEDAVDLGYMESVAGLVNVLSMMTTDVTKSMSDVLEYGDFEPGGKYYHPDLEEEADEHTE